MQNIPFTINYQGMLLSGYASSIHPGTNQLSLKIFIKGSLGILTRQNEKWSMDQPIDPTFVNTLGKYIDRYVQTVEKVMHSAQPV